MLYRVKPYKHTWLWPCCDNGKMDGLSSFSRCHSVAATRCVCWENVLLIHIPGTVFIQQQRFLRTMAQNCDWDYRYCSASLCVPYLSRCNEEESCPNSHPLPCKTSLGCYSKVEECDGLFSCPDGTDEDGCYTDTSRDVAIAVPVIIAIITIILLGVLIKVVKNKRKRQASAVAGSRVSSGSITLPPITVLPDSRENNQTGNFTADSGQPGTFTARPSPRPMDRRRESSIQREIVAARALADKPPSYGSALYMQGGRRISEDLPTYDTALHMGQFTNKGFMISEDEDYIDTQVEENTIVQNDENERRRTSHTINSDRTLQPSEDSDERRAAYLQNTVTISIIGGREQRLGLPNNSDINQLYNRSEFQQSVPSTSELYPNDVTLDTRHVNTAARVHPGSQYSSDSHVVVPGDTPILNDTQESHQIDTHSSDNQNITNITNITNATDNYTGSLHPEDDSSHHSESQASSTQVDTYSSGDIQAHTPHSQIGSLSLSIQDNVRNASQPNQSLSTSRYLPRQARVDLSNTSITDDIQNNRSELDYLDNCVDDLDYTNEYQFSNSSHLPTNPSRNADTNVTPRLDPRNNPDTYIAHDVAQETERIRRTDETIVPVYL